MTVARFLVSGKVQGVWFRASTQQEAVRLRLRGYARNLPDGAVEVVAQGDEEALAELGDWLRHGPPLAKVDEVRREALDSTGDAPGFSIR